MTKDPTDYVVRSTRRSPGNRVTYVVVDGGGRVTHVSVPFARSVPELVDPVIRRVVSQYPGVPVPT